MRLYCIVVYYGPLFMYCHFSLLCVSVFWLFWLSYQYLPSDWLERLLWGSPIVARGLSPESPWAEECAWFSWFIVLLHCFIMYLCCLLPIRDIFSYCYGAL